MIWKNPLEERLGSKAQKLESWGGFVFWDNKYYTSVEECAEELYSFYDKKDLPTYVWVCEEKPFPKIDIFFILDYIAEHGYQGIVDDIIGYEALDNALEAFAEVNKHLVGYLPDYTRMVNIKVYIDEYKRDDRENKYP